MNENIKEWIQYIICIVCLLGAMTMSFLAMYIDPQGQIDNSILWLIAQVLVFSGSIIGIGSIHQIQTKKIGVMIDQQTSNVNHKQSCTSQDNIV